MTVEKLAISEIDKHDGYASATKAGNTVWNARSTQKVFKEEDKMIKKILVKVKNWLKKVIQYRF